jgi:hypothetical protein
VIAHAGGGDEGVAILMVFGAVWLGWIGWTRVRGRGFSRIPRGAGIALLAVAGVLAIGSAVLPRALFPEDPAAVAAGPRPASTASLSFVSPQDGAQVIGEVEVELELQGARVIEETTSTASPDEGHLHLAVNGRMVSMTYGSAQMIDMAAYGPGTHVLEAEFVAGDHLPFEPRVTDTVTVVVPEDS